MKIYSLLFFVFFLSATICLAANDPTTSAPKKSNNQEKTYRSVEERRLLVALQEERINLQNEREDLADRKKSLKRLQDEVDKKLEELKQQRIQLEELLAEKDTQELKRVKDLSKMYEKMTAEKAARVFGTLEQDLAVSRYANHTITSSRGLSHSTTGKYQEYISRDCT
ncbi:MAG: hypothetical protein CSA26_02250 [Desulfobacterales bacterium]|nr:MAG: hypothetical protein CSA26_02250 [Desulfobacterales bacterium]